MLKVKVCLLGAPYMRYCRSCKDDGEQETITHLLCNCLSFSSLGAWLGALESYCWTERKTIPHLLCNCLSLSSLGAWLGILESYFWTVCRKYLTLKSWIH